MKITKVVLRRLALKMKGAGFRTSFAQITQKDFSLIELHSDSGLVGYGECSPLFFPWYSEETTLGAISVLQTVLIPSLLDAGEIASPEAFFDATSWIRRNRMARAAVD